MTFTATELRLLAIADQSEDVQRVGQGRGGGRPRTRPSTPRIERERKRALAWYYAKKSNQQGHDR